MPPPRGASMRTKNERSSISIMVRWIVEIFKWGIHTKLVSFLHKIFDTSLIPFVMDVRKLSKIILVLNNVYIQRQR